MGTDHFLARKMSKLLDRPVLRFFTWEPYCVSLGFHQNSAEINNELCRVKGIDLVKRPTGGRAILHAEELTYSVIYPFQSMDVMDFYRMVHMPLVAALQDIKVPAEFQAVQPDFKKFYKSENSAVCFAASARYEVEVEGKKLIGSAQRVYENSILQHGSLLLGPYHENLADLLEIPEQKRAAVRSYVKNHTAWIWQYEKNIRAAELALQIEKNFSKIYGINFTPITENKSLMDAIEEQVPLDQLRIPGNP